MPAATVKDFDPAKGFGTLTLEDGAELIFDIAFANVRAPVAGDRCEVEVGVGWKGRPKATRVTFAIAPVAPVAYPTFEHGFEQLRAFGFFGEWDVAALHDNAEGGEYPDTMTRGDVGSLIQWYYGEGPGARGRADGVITLDWRYRNSSDDPVRDVCALCPEPLAIDFEPAEELGPLLATLNQVLTERGSGYRYFMIDVESDFYVIVCRTLEFEAQVATTGWLATG